MERFTKKFTDGGAYCEDIEDVGIEGINAPTFIGKPINKLAEYEDAEEQGMLLRLPCKVGDEFWVIAYHSEAITHVKCSGYTIQEDIPNGIKHAYIWIDSIEKAADYWKLDFEDFKKQCFVTKAEAEQALKQKQEGEE